jgi:hypothetical protein
VSRDKTARDGSSSGGFKASGDNEDEEGRDSQPFKLLLQEAFSATDSDVELVSANDIRQRALEYRMVRTAKHERD